MDGLYTTLFDSGISQGVLNFLDKEELDEWPLVDEFFKDRSEERFIYSNINRSEVSIIRKVLSTRTQLKIVHFELQKVSQLVGGDIYGYLRGGVAEEYEIDYDYDYYIAAAAEIADEEYEIPRLEPLNAHVDDDNTRLVITRFEQFNTFELLESVQNEGPLLEVDVLKLSNLLLAVYKTQQTILN